jgi:hypothetical protein
MVGAAISYYMASCQQTHIMQRFANNGTQAHSICCCLPGEAESYWLAKHLPHTVEAMQQAKLHNTKFVFLHSSLLGLRQHLLCAHMCMPHVLAQQGKVSAQQAAHWDVFGAPLEHISLNQFLYITWRAAAAAAAAAAEAVAADVSA